MARLHIVIITIFRIPTWTSLINLRSASRKDLSDTAVSFPQNLWFKKGSVAEWRTWWFGGDTIGVRWEVALRASKWAGRHFVSEMNGKVRRIQGNWYVVSDAVRLQSKLCAYGLHTEALNFTSIVSVRSTAGLNIGTASPTCGWFLCWNPGNRVSQWWRRYISAVQLCLLGNTNSRPDRKARW